MANPDDEKTVINVKGVSVRAWERAKKAAAHQGQTMGEWLSRAANHLADREDGPRELPPLRDRELTPVLPAALPVGLPGLPPDQMRALPAPPAAPEPLTVERMGALMQGMAAVIAASGVKPPKTDLRRVYAVADDLMREGRGLPPRPVKPPPPRRGKAGGKESPTERQPETKTLDW